MLSALEDDAMAAEDGKDPCNCALSKLANASAWGVIRGLDWWQGGRKEGVEVHAQESMATSYSEVNQCMVYLNLGLVKWTGDVVLGHRPFQLHVSVEVIAQILVPGRQPVARPFILAAGLVHSLLQDVSHISSRRSRKT